MEINENLKENEFQKQWRKLENFLKISNHFDILQILWKDFQDSQVFYTINDD